MSAIRGIKFDRIDCVFCEGEVARTEKGRPITLEECGSAQLFDKIRALIVADAICLACRVKYLAWIDARAVVDGNAVPYSRTSDSFMALSFRSTFSDEPGPDDMPEFSVVWRPELTPWPLCERCGKPRASAEDLEPDEVMGAECSRNKDVSRAIRATLKQHGRGLLPDLKVVKLKTNETTWLVDS